MQTVVFDVDDTLYDQLQAFRQAVWQEIDHSIPEEMVKSLYKRSREYSDEVFDKQMSGEWTALQLQTYRIIKACEDFQIPFSHKQAVGFQKTYLGEQKKIQLFKPMRHLLACLAASHVQLAILTNGETAHQRMKIDQLELSRWIPENHVFISGEIGFSKPSLQTFEYIEDQIKINKEETIYIGDSFENDIVGAHHAGWKSIWLNHRNRQPTQADIKADYEIKKPEDILSIMSQIIDIDIWSEAR